MSKTKNANEQLSTPSPAQPRVIWRGREFSDGSGKVFRIRIEDGRVEFVCQVSLPNSPSGDMNWTEADDSLVMRSIAQEYLRDEDMMLVVVGDRDEIADQLSAFGEVTEVAP